jgi:hypothetical protein
LLFFVFGTALAHQIRIRECILDRDRIPIASPLSNTLSSSLSFRRLPVPTTEAAEATRAGDPPPEALVAIKNIIDGWNSEPTDHGSEAAQSTAADIALQPPKALCGRVANVAIWEQAQYELLEEIRIKPGTFVRLRNAHEGKLMSGLRCKKASRLCI